MQESLVGTLTTPQVQDCCQENQNQIKVLKLTQANLDGEHDDLVSLINQKLNALDNLQKLSD